MRSFTLRRSNEQIQASESRGSRSGGCDDRSRSTNDTTPVVPAEATCRQETRERRTGGRTRNTTHREQRDPTESTGLAQQSSGTTTGRKEEEENVSGTRREEEEEGKGTSDS